MLFFCLDIKSVLAKVLLVIQSFPSLTIGDCLGHGEKKGKQMGGNPDALAGGRCVDTFKVRY